MAHLILQGRFTQQPQGAVEIDLTSPLTDGLYDGFNAGSYLSSIYGKVLTFSNDINSYFAPGVSAKGRFYGKGATNLGVSISQKTYNGTSDESFTITIVGTLQAALTAANAPALSAGTYQNPIVLGDGTNPRFGVALRLAGDSLTRYITDTVNAVVGETYTLTTVYKNGTGIKFFKNGFLVSEVSETRNLVAGFGHCLWRSFTGPHLALHHRVALPDDAVLELHANPWQIFRKRPQILYFDVASGGATTLDVEAGSYTLTGVSASFDLTQASTAGSYEVTGQSAAFDTVLKVSAGSYTVTGADANLIATGLDSYTLSAEAGAYSLTGVAAVFALEQKSAVGSYTLTGQAASFDTLLLVQAGSYSITGADADLIPTGISSYTLAAESGAYTLTGQASTFDTELNLAAGAYSLTGSASKFDVTLAAQAGAYTLTGADADLVAEVSYTLAAEAGAYSITGADANLILSSIGTASTGGGGGKSRVESWESKFAKRKAFEEKLFEEEPPETVVLTPIATIDPITEEVMPAKRTVEVAGKLMPVARKVKPAYDFDAEEEELLLLL